MLSKILYHGILMPLSKLPYWFLYGVSDLFFVLLYYVIGYRKKVVRGNLERVFKDKDAAWIRQTERKFYRHFCDLIVETVKQFSVSEEEALKRMVHENTEVFASFAANNQPVIIAGGHMGNWELWAITAPLMVPHRVLAIYKKLSDPYFDKMMKSNRGRWGTLMVPTFEVAEYLRHHGEEKNAVVFAVDQSPSNPRRCIWMDFLGNETAVYFGVEKMAKDHNYPVVFGHVFKTRRGHYTSSFELVTKNPMSYAHGELVIEINRILEKDIYQQPEIWLWSHKRWKHSKPVA